MTQPSVPNPPVGVPAWATRLAAALVGIAGPVVAWIDPAHRIPPGAVQAAVILAFLAAGLVIFAIHLIHSDVHEYGWTMAAARHVESDAEAEFRQAWPQIKQAFEDAKPVLDQVHGVSGVIDALSKDVTDLKAREQTTGLDPTAVLQALETATGTTWPRSAAVTGQAS